ncbi:MAG: hypothetical protein KKF44_06890 [Nanoarchaeota archaeon]|nr:hypothetical protein [Nanoarchaeota archaeon]
MKCSLCDKLIEKYSVEFNHFKIDDSHSAEICQECIDKFFRWQGELYARLFPTKAMKKRFNRK